MTDDRHDETHPCATGRYGNKDGGVYWEEMLLPDEPADAKL